jgi:hypothetical protein
MIKQIPKIATGNQLLDRFTARVADTMNPVLRTLPVADSRFLHIFMGSGVPSNTLGKSGDYYFRTDTPGTANQRIYVNNAGSWLGIV